MEDNFFLEWTVLCQHPADDPRDIDEGDNRFKGNVAGENADGQECACEHAKFVER